MRREEFKKITKEHIETAKKLVESKGDCDFVDCEHCPFDDENLVGDKNCEDYSTTDTDPIGTDEDLLKSAQEFLQLFERSKCTTTNPILNEKLKNGDKEVAKLVEKTFEVFKDNVNSPTHYKLNISGHDIEVIDIIRAILTPEEFRGYLKGNILKYIMRESNKNHIEDLEKCDKYLDWLIKKDKEEKDQ